MTTAFAPRMFRGADGLTLWGDVGGTAGAAAVILLHGGGQTRRSWAAAADEFAAAGYYVINLDARGHGESAWAADGRYGLDQLAADVRQVIADLPGKVALVGASMGGVTALHLAASGSAPNIAALVMVDIVPRIEKIGGDKIKAFMRAHPHGFATLEDAVEAVVAYNPHRPRPSDPSGLMTNLRRRDDGRLYWHWDPRLIDGPHPIEPPEYATALLAASRRITIPVMLVRGMNSDIVSDEGIAEFRAVLPHLEVAEVPKAGHMVAGDRNDMFNACVLAFLRRTLQPT